MYLGVGSVPNGSHRSDGEVLRRCPTGSEEGGRKTAAEPKENEFHADYRVEPDVDQGTGVEKRQNWDPNVCGPKLMVTDEVLCLPSVFGKRKGRPKLHFTPKPQQPAPH
jgi:hypothetical protein